MLNCLRVSSYYAKVLAKVLYFVLLRRQVFYPLFGFNENKAENSSQTIAYFLAGANAYTYQKVISHKLAFSLDSD